MTTEAQLQLLVNNFLADVSKLARQAALETVSDLLNNVGLPASAVIGSRATPTRTATAPSSGGKASRGGKRPAGDLASLQQRVRDHVQRHPGQRVTDINAALGTSTGELRLPLGKLLNAGALRTTGQKRATQYYPA